MTAFRTLLAAMFVVIVAYTSVTIGLRGWNLYPVFFGDVATIAWPGQFDLDFMCFLILSGLWMAWRHEFYPTGLALGLLGLVGGTPVLSAYLFVASRQADGDWVRLMLGPARAQRALQARRA